MSVFDRLDPITVEYLVETKWWQYSKTSLRFVKNCDELNIFIYIKEVPDGWEIYDSLNAPSRIITDRASIDMYVEFLRQTYERV